MDLGSCWLVLKNLTDMPKHTWCICGEFDDTGDSCSRKFGSDSFGRGA